MKKTKGTVRRIQSKVVVGGLENGKVERKFDSDVILTQRRRIFS
jgi:hypothetical protein